MDDAGQPVPHTPDRIIQLFDEELSRVLTELPAGTPVETVDQFKQARRLCENLIVSGEFRPV